MAITIRHLQGPLAKQEQHFDDSVELILFGRSPECQVFYPADFTIVGRKHFEHMPATTLFGFSATAMSRSTAFQLTMA